MTHTYDIQVKRHPLKRQASCRALKICLNGALLAALVAFVMCAVPTSAVAGQGTLDAESSSLKPVSGSIQTASADTVLNSAPLSGLQKPVSRPPTPPAKKPYVSAPGISALGALAPTARRIVINVPARQLYLYQGPNIIKSYAVGVGRPGFPTPLGQYQVIRRVIDPGWENPYLAKGQVRIRPGIDNPLGTRWIGFKEDAKGEFGIHGTDTPSSVGKYSSHGCVRMFVRQAEELFDLVQVGTPVQVVYEPVVVRQKDQKIWVSVYPDAFRKGVPSLAALKTRISRDYPDAALNVAQLQQALKIPAQKPVLVGQIVSPPLPTALETKAATPLVDISGSEHSASVPENIRHNAFGAMSAPAKTMSDSNTPVSTVDMFSLPLPR